MCVCLSPRWEAKGAPENACGLQGCPLRESWSDRRGRAVHIKTTRLKNYSAILRVEMVTHVLGTWHLLGPGPRASFSLLLGNSSLLALEPYPPGDRLGVGN